MTVKELYEWAIEHECENYEIQISDVDYYGYRDANFQYKNEHNKTVEID